MLKRIDVKHLTLGMYLQEFCGSWMEHPFWRTKFILSDPKDLALIRATAIREVWIDVSRGKDVAVGTTSLSREEVDARIDTDFSHLEDLPPMVVEPSAQPLPSANDRASTTMQGELRRAASICSQAKQAVVSMFSEARMGRAVDSASV